MSPLIFDLGMEPLAIELRKKLSGIEVGEHKAKVSLYVDDTEIFVKDHFDLKKSKKILKKFNKQSAMKININKCSILDLGEKRIPCGSFTIPRVETDQYLGIIIGKGKNVEQKLVQDFHNACVSWQGKECNPLGKVTLVNAYCVGKLAYAVPFLTITAAKVNKINADYWNAIWSRKGF